MGQQRPNERAAKTPSEGIHPVIDTMEMRLRCELLREAQDSADPNTVVVKALEYAAEAEQRIAELNARVRTLESLAKTDELTGLLGMGAQVVHQDHAIGQPVDGQKLVVRRRRHHDPAQAGRRRRQRKAFL